MAACAGHVAAWSPCASVPKGSFRRPYRAARRGRRPPRLREAPVRALAIARRKTALPHAHAHATRLEPKLLRICLFPKQRLLFVLSLCDLRRNCLLYGPIKRRRCVYVFCFAKPRPSCSHQRDASQTSADLSPRASVPKGRFRRPCASVIKGSFRRHSAAYQTSAWDGRADRSTTSQDGAGLYV